MHLAVGQDRDEVEGRTAAETGAAAGERPAALAEQQVEEVVLQAERGVAIGRVEITLQDAIPAAPFARSRELGSLILVDPASNSTAAAVLVE